MLPKNRLPSHLSSFRPIHVSLYSSFVPTPARLRNSQSLFFGPFATRCIYFWALLKKTFTDMRLQRHLPSATLSSRLLPQLALPPQPLSTLFEDHIFKLATQCISFLGDTFLFKINRHGYAPTKAPAVRFNPPFCLISCAD